MDCFSYISPSSPIVLSNTINSYYIEQRKERFCFWWTGHRLTCAETPNQISNGRIEFRETRILSSKSQNSNLFIDMKWKITEQSGSVVITRVLSFHRLKAQITDSWFQSQFYMHYMYWKLLLNNNHDMFNYLLMLNLIIFVFVLCLYFYLYHVIFFFVLGCI